MPDSIKSSDEARAVEAVDVGGGGGVRARDFRIDIEYIIKKKKIETTKRR